MADHRKRAVSIRLSHGDLRNIKRCAKRLGVRDSDVIRFAIKATMSRIAPLCDPEIRGRNLVPVLIETGDELIRYFELDAYRLEAIINESVDAARQVDRDDIALLAMSGLRDDYLLLRMESDPVAGQGAGGTRSLRRYLYERYVHRTADPVPAATLPSPPNGKSAADQPVGGDSRKTVPSPQLAQA